MGHERPSRHGHLARCTSAHVPVPLREEKLTLRGAAGTLGPGRLVLKGDLIDNGASGSLIVGEGAGRARGTVAVSGDCTLTEHFGTLPLQALTEIADKQIRRAIETVDGVGEVTISGGRAREIHIVLDVEKAGRK